MIFLIYSYVKIKERCLLSTVLVDFSTDTEMLFSVAGFQISTVKEKKSKNYKLDLYIICVGLELEALEASRGLGDMNLLLALKKG